MKPILLLAPAEDGKPARERRGVELRRDAAASGVARAADYTAVLVLNEGGVDTLRRLRLALALRRRHPRLRVGMLTYLGNGPPAAGAGDPLDPGARSPPALAELGPELKVELRDQVLSLEYQAD